MSVKAENSPDSALVSQPTKLVPVQEMNTVQSPATLVPKGLRQYTFQPGKSGNPGGRPKGLPGRIRALTREGEDILEFLVDVLKNEIKSTTKDRLQAAQILLDRGYGKAVETSVQVQLDAKNGESTNAIDDLADAELESMARQLKNTNSSNDSAPSLAPVLPSK